jgi:hypothetical protein
MNPQLCQEIARYWEQSQAIKDIRKAQACYAKAMLLLERAIGAGWGSKIDAVLDQYYRRASR